VGIAGSITPLTMSGALDGDIVLCDTGVGRR
jgi:hypothetical protein